MPRGADMDRAFKERCITLRRAGLSLTEIVKETGRSKTSIYSHICHIPLSPERLALAHKRAGERIKMFPLARKGKSVRPFKMFTEWEEEQVTLVAHFIFDGELSVRRGCIYNNRSLALIEKVELCARSVYDFEPKRYTNPVTGVHRISYYNVALASYLKQRADDLLSNIKDFDRNLKRCFLQSFFDDEGCMDYRPKNNRRKVRGYQKDVRILMLVRDLLSDFDISAAILHPNEIAITGKASLIRFENEINFSQGVCVNGSRTNSRWKQNIEKRRLLRMAIQSYKR